MSIKKTLVGIVLTGMMSGCEERGMSPQPVENEVTFTFDSFGKYRVGNHLSGVATADVDGDGDQDIILVNAYDNSTCCILENKMPQKKYENK